MAFAIVPAGSAVPATASFDGIWHVSIVTRKGECESGKHYPVRITSGTLTNANDTGLFISGTVSDNGQVAVSVNARGKSATGSGQLSQRSGSGRWSGDSCSGTWSAQRRNNGRVAPYQNNASP